VVPGLNTRKPNIARMFDYYLGGKDNFAADREAAEHVMRIMPGAAQSARESRRFLRRAVSFLAGEEGITQFLDIGVGLPTRGAVHEIAQEFSPSVRVVYADHDPVVVSHAEVLLAESNVSTVVRGDLRRPRELLSMPEVRDFLDFSQPIAVILQLIVHYVADADDPAGIVAALRDAVVPGSYLVLSHISPDALGSVAARQAELRAAAVYQGANEPMIPRSRVQIEGFFDGWDLVEPGLVPKNEWRPAADVPSRVDVSLAGVARKP
jgi:SAM-dependent methyltransferase